MILLVVQIHPLVYITIGSVATIHVLELEVVGAKYSQTLANANVGCVKIEPGSRMNVVINGTVIAAGHVLANEGMKGCLNNNHRQQVC
jgi:hypothetical protein